MGHSAIYLLAICGIELAAGFVLAWPVSAGFLARTVRLVALSVGMAAPLLLYLSLASPGLPGLLATVVACWLCSATVALAATGWRELLGRHGHAADQVDLSLFNPLWWTDSGHPTTTSDGSSLWEDLVGGVVASLLLALLLALVGGLIWVGLNLARFVATHLLPLPGGVTRCIARAGLSFTYALVIFTVTGLAILYLG